MKNKRERYLQKLRDKTYAPTVAQSFAYDRTAIFGIPAKLAADKVKIERIPIDENATRTAERARKRADRVPYTKQTKRNAKFWAAVQLLLDTGKMTLDEAKSQVKITN